MASLTAHLVESGGHGRLGFHASCPVCRQERLFGSLSSETVVSRRAQAALASGVLALSAVGPPVAAAQEPDQQLEGGSGAGQAPGGGETGSGAVEAPSSGTAAAPPTEVVPPAAPDLDPLAPPEAGGDSVLRDVVPVETAPIEAPSPPSTPGAGPGPETLPDNPEPIPPHQIPLPIHPSTSRNLSRPPRSWRGRSRQRARSPPRRRRRQPTTSDRTVRLSPRRPHPHPSPPPRYRRRQACPRSPPPRHRSWSRNQESRRAAPPRPNPGAITWCSPATRCGRSPSGSSAPMPRPPRSPGRSAACGSSTPRGSAPAAPTSSWLARSSSCGERSAPPEAA